MNALRWFTLLVALFIRCESAYEGDECTTENSKGQCILIDKCDYAKNLLQSNKRPQHCGFEGNIPIVCCPLTAITKEEIKDYGKKSIAQCEKYYPVSNIFGIAVAGGKQTRPKEFPHMALLGYGDKSNIKWQCGGSLVSDFFVLTAAHCLESKEGEKVSTVRLGELDVKDTKDDARPEDFGVAKAIAHPNFKPPSHYNDIALIKLNRKVSFNSYIQPVCLHTGGDLKNFRLSVTGWGKTDFAGETSSHLMKAEMDLVDYATCASKYQRVPPRRLERGIFNESQICAGTADGKDTCPGDSGGPLQILVRANEVTANHFLVVGVTSFGKACGIVNSAGVYTRVAPFVSWIESIVWPST